MANEAQDKITERHAHIIAHEYGIAPLATKCERTIRTGTDICTTWLCRKDGAVRILVKYHADDLKHSE